MRPTHVAALLLAVPVLASCAADGDPTQPAGPAPVHTRSLTVSASNNACRLSATHASAGTLTFDVTNTGSKVTQFYLLSEESMRILGQVGNIGPQLTRQLVVNAPFGAYKTVCKPGQQGDRIETDFTVTPSEKVGADSAIQRLREQATAKYAAYTKVQSGVLVENTRRFVKAYKAGDDDTARLIYANARVHWGRIEPVAESFPDLDAKLDRRAVDVEDRTTWTGWHRIEKDLWPKRAGADYKRLVPTARKIFADTLLSDIQALDRRLQSITYAVDQVANGSSRVIDEVARRELAGEEEYWSRADLFDLQGNLDGARAGFEDLQPIVEQADPGLAVTLTQGFDQLQTVLDRQRVRADRFKAYNQLNRPQIRALGEAVDALSEPLSRLTTTVLS